MVIVAIFYPFSQFCEISIFLLNLQKQSNTAPNLFQRGVEYGKYDGGPWRFPKAMRRQRAAPDRGLTVIMIIIMIIIILMIFMIFMILMIIMIVMLLILLLILLLLIMMIIHNRQRATLEASRGV